MNKELIGATVEIVAATNKTMKGKKGRVIDETKNTITIEANNKQIKVIKNTITLKIDEKIIEGKTITKRSYERTKA